MDMLTWKCRLGIDVMFPFLNLCEEWRDQRRVFQQYYSQASLHQYRWSQLGQARAFVGWVLDSPMTDVRRLIRRSVMLYLSFTEADTETMVRFTTAVIVEVLYGKTLSGPDDEYIHVSQRWAEGFDAASVPGRYWVEYFPFLRHIPGWVPGTATKQLVQKYGQCTARLRNDAYDEFKKSLVRHSQLEIVEQRDDLCGNHNRMPDFPSHAS